MSIIRTLKDAILTDEQNEEVDRGLRILLPNQASNHLDYNSKSSSESVSDDYKTKSRQRSASSESTADSQEYSDEESGREIIDR